jgi:hypothetical protein
VRAKHVVERSETACEPIEVARLTVQRVTVRFHDAIKAGLPPLLRFLLRKSYGVQVARPGSLIS